jgi:hypothetical protein
MPSYLNSIRMFELNLFVAIVASGKKFIGFYKFGRVFPNRTVFFNLDNINKLLELSFFQLMKPF